MKYFLKQVNPHELSDVWMSKFGLNRRNWVRISVAIASVSVFYTLSRPVQAQILPDASLANPSAVTTEGTIQRITGGTEIGGSLFHSFQEFSLMTGNTAFFDNSLTVENILTRVTGLNPSQIDGIIRANGSANLYLINPNGIVFGPNAQLNLGGSFFASTAESIVLGNGTLFNARNPESPPLLTVNVPVGLQFGPNPGNIGVFSQGIDSSGEVSGLQVFPGQTIGLFGGNVLLDGGQMRSPGGRIEIGSVAGNSRISLTPTERGMRAGYEGVESFQDIQLTQRSGINTSGDGGGTIHLQGRRIAVGEGSQVLAVNVGLLTGGSVNLKSSELVAITGADPDNFTVVVSDTRGVGTGGDLNIETGQFLLQGTGLVSASTFGLGAGGNLTIKAADSITVIGVGFEPLELLIRGTLTGQLQPEDRIPGLVAGTVGEAATGNMTLEAGNAIGLYNGALIHSPTFGDGVGGNLQMRAGNKIEAIAAGVLFNTAFGSNASAGDITIETRNLIITDGTVISSGTLGNGPGGDIVVNASELVEISGTVPGNVLPTGILNNTLFGTGTGGNVTIKTTRLINRGGALISANSGGGNTNSGLVTAGGVGGNINIEASESIEISGVSPDGLVTSGPGTTTFSENPAGNLTISTGRLSISDGAIVSSATFNSGDGGTLTVNATEGIDISGQSPITGLPSTLVSSSGRADIPDLEVTGSGGNLRVNTGELVVRDGATLDVRSIGAGNAGILEIVADSVRVDTGGSLNAATVSGAGGNIQLRSNTLLLRREGNITTNAGNTDGGNITIDTQFLTALENSDITANALAGRGGRVSISAEGIFGTEFREAQTPRSDITATSDLGPEFSGTVELNTPDADSSLGVVPLQDNFVNADQLIAQNFCAADDVSSLTVTGRGGLPDSPTELLNSPVILDDLRLVQTQGTAFQSQSNPVGEFRGEKMARTTPLVEAQGWTVTPEGTVVLVTEAPQVTPHSSWVTQQNCEK
ncbi:filamentous hemagglutinin N-terminal domain-containing protein [Oscillatoria acuminata]|uniref:Filamentous hemagglutinin family N-terminal domain protein n=1 Tax=Oscillatoria acuminata PCC 6304 TaxID=56110 RepID=K9TEM9_9CYAN|nr:S-layer family protein [Oscillatoria acuminata]AFY80863.1 filamentous hemagglutinin family N-terminal domain protein [Oscillatoria acuminata PCC 6304]